MKKIMSLLFVGIASLAIGIEKPDADFQANHCEFYVNGFVAANGYYVFNWQYLRSFVSVDEINLVTRQGGRIEQVGALGNGKDVFLGTKIAPAYYVIRIDTLPLESTGTGGYRPGTEYPLQTLAYFVDVRRSNGRLERLWLTSGGNDFRWPDFYNGYPTVAVHDEQVGRGSAYALISDAWNSSPLFNQRRACAH